MENGGNGGFHHKISASDVISKLKDDGDFDRLRLKIIRKLKENEELRSDIISMVKQSATLNRPGAENMKPHQLSEAIHQDVGDKVMSQISDRLWDIIRSPNGMKDEITETVQSVYNKLLDPIGKDGAGTSSNGMGSVQEQVDNNTSQTASPHHTDDITENEPNEPPGFSVSNHHQNNHVVQTEGDLLMLTPCDKAPTDEQSNGPQPVEDVMEQDNVDLSGPPGFCAAGESKAPGNNGDDDPDVPPGFG